MSSEKNSVPRLAKRKNVGPKISVVTAYDFPSARLADEAGIDVVLVGDSLGNVVQGKLTTLPVTLKEMIYHAEMVVRAVSHAIVVVDLPFPYTQLGPKKALSAAAKIIKQTSADAVKIEGGINRAEAIRAIVDAGIPVMGHCGLLPQSIRKMGGFVIQKNIETIMKDVEAVQAAGAFSVVLECMPQGIAKEITKSIGIPTIGIGAGPDCDGQVLVFHDLLGFSDTNLRHVKPYAKLGKVIRKALRKYHDEVQNGTFPTDENSF